MKLNESSFLLGEELDFEKVHMISNDKISISLSEHLRVKIETSNRVKRRFDPIVTHSIGNYW